MHIEQWIFTQNEVAAPQKCHPSDIFYTSTTQPIARNKGALTPGLSLVSSDTSEEAVFKARVLVGEKGNFIRACEPVNKGKHPIAKLIAELQALPEGTTYTEREGPEFYGGQTGILGTSYQINLDITEGLQEEGA